MWKKVKKAHDAASGDEAYAYALRVLQVRWQGEAELKQKLALKGFAEPAILACLKRLTVLKYLEDERVLEGLVRERRDIGLYGPLWVRQKLMQRKFSRSQIDWALATFYPPSEELRVARVFFGKQKVANTEDVKERQRIMQKFLRRGFSPQVVYAVIGTIHGEVE